MADLPPISVQLLLNSTQFSAAISSVKTASAEFVKQLQTGNMSIADSFTLIRDAAGGTDASFRKLIASSAATRSLLIADNQEVAGSAVKAAAVIQTAMSDAYAVAARDANVATNQEIADAERLAAAQRTSMEAFSAGAATMVSRGRSISSMGMSLSTTLTLPLVAIGVAATHAAESYSKAMGIVAAHTNYTQEQVKQFGTQVVQTASDVGVKADDAANALYVLGSNGVPAAEAMKTLNEVLKGTVTGLGDAQTVARLASSMMNAYAKSGLTAANAMDVMTQTVKEGNLKTDELSKAMGRVLPIASEVGVHLGDVGAAFAVLSKEGMSASNAASALQGMLKQLVAPSKGTQDALKSVGLSAQSLREEISTKGLLAGLRDLDARFDGNIDKMGSVFKNVRGLNGVLTILGQNNQAVSDSFQRVNNAAGAADAAFNKVASTGAFKLQKAMNDLHNSLISIGNVLMPIIANIAKFIADLADKFSQLNPTVQQFIVYIGLAAAALGPLIMIIGGLITAVGTIGAAFSAEAAPVILAIVGIAAVLIALWNNSQTFRDNIISLWKTVSGAIGDAVNEIKKFLQDNSDKVKDFQAVFKVVGDYIGGVIVPILKITLVVAIKLVVEAIKLCLTEMWLWVKAFEWIYNHSIPFLNAAIKSALIMINDFIYAWDAIASITHAKHIDPLKFEFQAIGDAAQAASGQVAAFNREVGMAAADAAAFDNSAAAAREAGMAGHFTTANTYGYGGSAFSGGGGSGGGGGGGGAGSAGKAAGVTLSDVKSAVGNLKSLLKEVGTSLTDLRSHSAVEFAGVESDIEKAFGSKGSVDSAVSQYDNLVAAVNKYYGALEKLPGTSNKAKVAYEQAAAAQNDSLKSQVQNIINLMNHVKELDAQLQQLQTDYTQKQAGINQYYDQMDKDAAQAVADITAHYDELIPKLQTALNTATTAYDTANKQLTTLIDAQTKMTDTIQSGMNSFLNNLSVDSNARTLEQSMANRLKTIQQFTADVQTALSRGVSSDLVQQIVAAGPGQGGAAAHELATASDTSIAHINNMQAQLSDQTTRLQAVATQQWYAAGIAQQQAIVDPLKAAVDIAQNNLDAANAQRATDLKNAQAYQAQMQSDRQAALAQAQKDYDNAVKAISGPGGLLEQTNTSIDTTAASINATFMKFSDPKTGLPANMTLMGKNTIQGMITGLGSMKGSLELKARELAQAAIQAMKDELGIKSPSQVMHEAGINMAQGLANGMNAGHTAVALAAVNLAKAANPSLPGGVNSQMGLQSSSFGKTTINNINVTPVTNADPHLIAREVAWSLRVGI